VKPGDPDHLELPYARAALAGLALCEEPRRMLVVGLGGGSLPMFCARTTPPQQSTLRRSIPMWWMSQSDFSDFGRTSECAPRSANGRQFIENARQADYDLIFLDAFAPATCRNT